MAIKISKVIKDLNVGRQTIEEFLHKKGIEIDASINARIQDDVYEMLVKEFKPDMDLKSKSDKMATERQKEKAKQNAAKAESHEIKTEVPVQKPKILGKIDLEARRILLPPSPLSRIKSPKRQLPSRRLPRRKSRLPFPGFPLWKLRPRRRLPNLPRALKTITWKSSSPSHRPWAARSSRWWVRWT